MSTLKVGDRVKVLKYWTGEGTITEIYPIEDSGYQVTMDTGPHKGRVGGFEMDQVELVSMKIVSLKRSTQKTGLKVYGKVQGESGKEYNVAYIRRSNFRGWICSCESFFFDMFKKKRNCKHLRFVRGQVGRFAASVKA